MRHDYFRRVWLGRPPWRGQGLASHPASKECCSPVIVIAIAIARVLRRHVLAGVTHADLSRSHGRVAGGVFGVVRDSVDAFLALARPYRPQQEGPHIRSEGNRSAAHGLNVTTVRTIAGD